MSKELNKITNYVHTKLNSGDNISKKSWNKYLTELDKWMNEPKQNGG
jgi:hypothetical protein